MSHEDEKIVKAIRTDGYKDVTNSVDFSKIDFIKICSDHKKRIIWIIKPFSKGDVWIYDS